MLCYFYTIMGKTNNVEEMLPGNCKITVNDAELAELAEYKGMHILTIFK